MLIGLTGGIGSGKSTVASLFNKYGVPVVDVDGIAKEVVQPGKEAWKKILECFGQDILHSDQTIDRKKLGRIIFEHAHKREKLNEITHPIIIKETMRVAERLQKEYSHVIVDIPLLFESKREALFNIIIVVYANKDIQLQRLMEREDISEKEALLKIQAQMNLEEKKKKADLVILNNQDLDATEKQVLEIIYQWKKGMDK